MEELEAWLKGSLRQKPNTIWNFFKTMRTYINLARAEGKIMDYPFDKFKIRRQDTDPVYVNEEELQRMFMLLQSEKLPNMQRRTLKRFLFSALTSLRYGDVHSITWKENIRDQQIEFIPAKTKRKGKIVRVPLLPEAAMMAENLTGNVFGKMSLQKINASLKIVAARCGISKKLSFHASRHTFGYLFIRRGGDVLTLKEIMGHSDINTTMIYVHLNDSQKREGIRRMEWILKSST